MTDESPKFRDGDPYKVRVEPGASLFKSPSGTLGLKGKLLVTSGEMIGAFLPMALYLTEKTKKHAKRQLAVLGFIVKGGDWENIHTLIAGKEAVAIAQDGIGQYVGQFKAGDIRSMQDYEEGGLAAQAAALFSETTPQDEY